jgi:hypothetical protein
MQYQTFSQKPDESLDDYFSRFESIVSNSRSCGTFAYSDNDSVWGMKITALQESTNFTTLDTEKLFNKLKYHELSRNGHPNHDAYLTSKTFITSARVSGHDSNPTNTTVSSDLEFVLSSLTTTSDEQCESFPDDEITLLVRKF